jgi:hypothetical protein
MNILAAIKQGGTNLICDSLRLLQADALIKRDLRSSDQMGANAPLFADLAR